MSGGVIGRPLPGVEVTLRPDGDMERVHVRSAAVATGYTDAASDGFGDGGFLTGDYGAWDAVGRLTLRGRVSSFVNVAGRKVQPDEVEHVLRDMPGVKRRACRGRAGREARPADRRLRRDQRGERHGADSPAVLRRASRAAQDPEKRRFSGRDPDDRARQNRSSRARRAGSVENSRVAL